MEFLVVNKTKLKAILDKEDMEKYNLDPECEGGGGAKARRAFREILAKAEEEVGFGTGRDKVLIQLYPSRDGGGEIFVTKLTAAGKQNLKAIADSDNVMMLATVKRLYKFDNLEDLILGAKCVKDEDIKSDVYYLQGAYFLAAEGRCEHSRFTEISRLSEFAERLPEKLIPYITEQGKLISEGAALEAFSRL